MKFVRILVAGLAALALAVVSVALTWWFLVPHAAAIHG